MTRHEIEILIRARSEAGNTFAQLGTGLKGVTTESAGAAAGLKGVETSTRGMTAGAAAAGAAAGVLAITIGAKLKEAFISTIAEANKLDAGLIGLSSIARSFGHDVDAARGAAVSLASDGLMTVGEAAAGLKNLLAAGFGLPEAISLMSTFKDTAAFGRQGALGFGEAIVGATEGIKNGNSIMVDNAGITKNLSNILVEAGFAATDLSKATTDANIRQALFNGILKEGAPMLGDSARLLETAAGKQAQFAAQSTIAQQAIGKTLQPALVSFLGVLTPVVQVLGQFAPVLVPLAAGVAAVIGPMLALNAATRLGLTDWVSMDSAMKVVKPSIEGTTLAAKGLNLALKAFVYYEIAQAIIALTEKYEGLNEQLQLSAKEHGGVTSQIGLTINEALVGNNHLVQIRKYWAQLKDELGLVKVAFEDLEDTIPRVLGKARDAAGNIELLLTPFEKMANLQIKGPPGLKEALATMKEFDAASNAVETSRKRVDEWRSAIETISSRGALPELKRQIDLGVLSNKELAQAFGVSEDAVKFYEKSLKDAADATKKKAAAAKELEQRIKEQKKEVDGQRQALEALGVITMPIVIKKLDELATLQKRATDEGRPLKDVVAAMEPEYRKLFESASGYAGAQAAVNAAWKDATERGGGLLTATQSYAGLLLTLPSATSNLTGEMRAQIAEITRQKGEQEKLETAWKTLGITSQAELQKTATEATAAYNTILASGTATPLQIKAAHERMVEAVKATTGQLPSQWQTEIVPGITRQLGLLQQSMTGSFAQMLTGAKGFGEGFLDIWKSLKQSVMNIFNEILKSFTDQLLGGIIKALAGGQGSTIANLFGGLFRGAGGGGIPGIAGAVPGLGGLLGGGVLPSAGFVGYAGLPGGAGAGAGATSLGAGGTGLLGALAGPGAGALAGGLTGYLTRSKGWGALAGAGTGAGIGAIFGGPLGAGIGAGVGALAGVLGGIFGGSKEKKENVGATEQIKTMQAELLKTFGTMEKIKAIGQVIGVDIVGEWGHQGKKGLELWTSELSKFMGKQEQLQGALGRYGLSWEDLGVTMKQANITGIASELLADMKVLEGAGIDQTKILTKMSGQYSELYQTILRTGTDAPASLQPILEKLIGMGLLVDENGDKITDLSGVKFSGLKESGTSAIDAIKAQLEGLVRSGELSADSVALVEGAFKKAGINSSSSVGEITAALHRLVAAGVITGEEADAIAVQFTNSSRTSTRSVDQIKAAMERLIAQEVISKDEADRIQKQFHQTGMLSAADMDFLSSRIDALVEKEVLSQTQADELKNSFVRNTGIAGGQVDLLKVRLENMVRDGLITAEEAAAELARAMDQPYRTAADRVNGINLNVGGLAGGLQGATVRANELYRAFDAVERRGDAALDSINLRLDGANDRLDRFLFGASPGGMSDVPPAYGQAMAASSIAMRSMQNDFSVIEQGLNRLLHMIQEIVAAWRSVPTTLEPPSGDSSPRFPFADSSPPPFPYADSSPRFPFADSSPRQFPFADSSPRFPFADSSPPPFPFADQPAQVQVQVYMAVDPSTGTLREMTRTQFRQIEGAIARGDIRIASGSVVHRAY